MVRARDAAEWHGIVTKGGKCVHERGKEEGRYREASNTCAQGGGRRRIPWMVVPVMDPDWAPFRATLQAADLT